MASKDSNDTKKKILVVNKSDNESGSKKEPNIRKDEHNGHDEGDELKKEPATSNPVESKAGETVVVLPKKPTNLTPLGGSSLFNSNAKAEENDPEKIVIKTPGVAKNGKGVKQTVVVGNDAPTDIAPLGNVSGAFSSSNTPGNDTTVKKNEVEEQDKPTKEGVAGKEEVREQDKSAKEGTYSKISTAATAATSAVTGAAAAGAVAMGIKDNKDQANGEDREKVAGDSKHSPSSKLDGTASEKDNHVSINEERNVSHTIMRTKNIPRRLENVPETSILNEFRRNNSVVAEGFMYKKRPWLFCFWVQKYFVFLRTGELLFIELDGTGSGSGNWNVKHSNALNKIDYEGYSHPSRLAFSSDTSTAYFAFDSQEERNYWFETFQDISRSK